MSVTRPDFRLSARPQPKLSARLSARKLRHGLALGLAALLLSPGAADSAAKRSIGYLVARKAIAAPSGFANSCGTYPWLCSSSGRQTLAPESVIGLATAVNRQVNHSVREISDRSQYGREEVWTLPSARGGDCEDFALLKKYTLIRQGVAPETLLLATVISPARGPHAVLVLRTTAGDLVLDNLTDRVRPWRATGYAFLRMQNPAQPGRWNAIFAGGMFES
ncbi:MAG: transglutaminase-like cysteine peptidase [Defluviimonas sp.]|uniref:transglutaminase-like cysteine peptidase n=1 Tax=Albidovulum sp. TaxID=1872424 RepID=UPI001D8BDA93|nr:transglutaminase-like cysteine peptidase [Paracoccaceae bacterium]MCC0063882.1 transglutaminase-like cysteine peptidase [Defluviimonas sp.]